MNNSKYHKVSIQHIRIIARWMTVVLFGLFFLMALINNINQSFVLNDVDIFLITLVIIYLIGILVSYRQEILAGYILSFSSAAYVIVQEFSISSWFFEVDGYYLLIPGVFFMVIGYLQSEINLHKMIVERLKKEVSELNQSYRLTKSMLDIVPDMIRNDDLDFILQKVLEKAIEGIPKAHAGSIILKFLSRVGGDEFVLVIPNSNHELALETVHLIETRCIENPFTFENIKLFYKFSYGISSFPNDTENLESLVKLSDERMYVNKRKKGI